MKRTIKVTRVIYEVSIVEVELTAKELKSMSKFELDALVGDLETDRDVTYTGQDILNVEVLEGHGLTFQLN